MTDTYFSSDSARTRVRFLAGNAVRVTHARPGNEDEPFPPDRPWLEHVLLPTRKFAPEQARLSVAAHEGCVEVRTREGELVLAEARPAQMAARGRTRLALRIHPGEGFYGWGEWFNAYRRERGTFTLRARESPAFAQRRRTYSAIPFFLSDQGYGFLLLNSHQSAWRIAPARGVLEVKAAGPPADYVVIHGPAFRDILATYTALTGKPPLVPRWAFGLWVTGYPQEHQDRVTALVEEHRQRSIPLDAVILDYHWEERFHNFRWRRELVPEPARLIAEMRARGVRLGLIITPFQNDRNQFLRKLLFYLYARNVPPGMLTRDERAPAAYEEAREKGYLAHPRAQWWFGGGGMVDFTNPEAVEWWNDRLRPLYGQGVAFFKNDDGEYLPDDARSHLGMDGREYHNLYGFFYGKAMYEGMTALDDRRPLIYARSVWAGSQRYPALFLGDQKPTFKFIRRTMRAGLNMGLAGFAYWTADVFGLDGRTTPETHVRYAQWALLVPVARYFVRPPDLDDTRFPWSHGPESGVEANFRTYADLRYRLLPYYYALAWEAHRAGLPILRPLMLEFQDDGRVREIDDQVMLGDRLMLAPVVEQGARAREIYLPAGTWHDFWSTRSYEGGRKVHYLAPLDRLPILVRGGTVLPMGPPLPHIPDDHRFDCVWLHAWPPYPAEGVLYDDDGTTRAYREGAFSVTHVTVEANAGRVVMRISPAQGDFAGQVESREVNVALHHCPAPAGVFVNGARATGWMYDPAEERTLVPVRCPVDTETVIEVSET